MDKSTPDLASLPPYSHKVDHNGLTRLDYELIGYLFIHGGCAPYAEVERIVGAPGFMRYLVGAIFPRGYLKMTAPEPDTVMPVFYLCHEWLAKVQA